MSGCVAGVALSSAVESSLRSVNLWNNKVCDKQARQYSGGMKRRLSVAISFMGNPLVVYLDEPSTVRVMVVEMGCLGMHAGLRLDDYYKCRSVQSVDWVVSSAVSC